jgi:hypothetical protein
MSAVFPMPGSPVIQIVRWLPSRSSSSPASIAVSSAARPISVG